jgi:hypothetical protein
MLIASLLAAAGIMGASGDQFDTSDDTSLGAVPLGAISISDASDLARIGTGVEYPAGSGTIWSLSAYYYLSNDITLSGTDNHGPIGGTAYFTGTLNGCGFAIDGIDMTVSGSYAGLFGRTNNATIRDLTLKNASITLTVAGYAGGIAGDSNNTAVVNCHVLGTVHAQAAGIVYVGGIVGNFRGGTIVGCSFEGLATASVPTSTVTSSPYAGGIVGCMFSGTISECRNAGSITATSAATSSSSRPAAGGMVGFANSSVITKCGNIGTVAAAHLAPTGTGMQCSAGGIIGTVQEDTAPINCFNVGTITATVSSSGTAPAARAGGMIGTTTGKAQYVFNCYNAGEIKTNTSSSNIGALSGNTVSTAVNCYALTKMLYVNGVLQTNERFGSSPSISLDGTSDPPRSAGQTSGFVTAAQMRPTLADAQANNSIYYTGTTNGLYLGWDFFGIWTIDPSVNGGYPTFGTNPKPETFVVMFDAVGGSFVVPQLVIEGNTAIQPSPPEKEGHDFIGWSRNGVPFSFSDQISDNITLTAIWERIVWAVTYVVDDETSFTEEVYEGSAAIKPSDPTKSGYKLIGWYLDGVPFDFGTPIAGGITLTAEWEEVERGNAFLAGVILIIIFLALSIGGIVLIATGRVPVGIILCAGAAIVFFFLYILMEVI